MSSSVCAGASAEPAPPRVPSISAPRATTELACKSSIARSARGFGPPSLGSWPSASTSTGPRTPNFTAGSNHGSTAPSESRGSSDGPAAGSAASRSRVDGKEPRMRMRARLITILIQPAEVAASAALVAAPAPATTTTAPGKNGAIAFKRYLDSVPHHGGDLHHGRKREERRQVTTPRGRNVDDQPDWAPDGSLLVFFRCAPDEPLRRLHRQAGWIGPDAAAAGLCGQRCEDGEGGTFLPDGTRVVFTRATGTVRAPRGRRSDRALRHRRARM